MQELVFVTAPRQNTFFVEIVAAIRDELARLGVESSVSSAGFPPPRAGLVYVLVPPHEWFALHARSHMPSAGQLRRTIGLCAEQPGTAFFEDDVVIGDRLGAILDVNPASLRAFRTRGLEAVHFPLGWTPTWSHVSLEDEGPQIDDPARDIDVLHLGIHSQRRARAIAASAGYLARWRCHLNLSDDHVPNFEAKPNYAVGAAKWELLTRSRVLLNLHVSERPYFEWQRVVQAVSNGCLVVSEHSTDHAPLEVGRHFLAGRAELLGLLAQRPLEDEGARRAIAREAWLMLRDELPLRSSVERLVEVAHDVDRTPIGEGARLPKLPLQSPQAEPHEELDMRDEFERVTRFPVAEGDPTAPLRAALKATQLDLLSVRRNLMRTRKEVLEGRPSREVELDFDSPAYAAAHPAISVVIALYNYERHISTALDSCAASEYSELEVVVVDDGSTDGSRKAVHDWARAHPGVPLRLLRHPVNRGLGAARNTGLDFARGPRTFILDADNSLYRRGLGRLVEALDENPDAAFVYGMLEMWSPSGAVGLQSVFPWRPSRFRTGNYIDAMSLWHTATLRELGGYANDPRLYGWEDFDLYCRVAEQGHRGVLVPQIVARYRVSSHSMLSVTNLSTTVALSMLIDRHPKLMAGMHAPA